MPAAHHHVQHKIFVFRIAYHIASERQILSNGLENAWDALKALAWDKRKVSVQMKYSRDYLIIRIKNRCREELQQRNHMPFHIMLHLPYALLVFKLSFQRSLLFLEDTLVLLFSVKQKLGCLSGGRKIYCNVCEQVDCVSPDGISGVPLFAKALFGAAGFGEEGMGDFCRYDAFVLCAACFSAPQIGIQEKRNTDNPET